MVLCEDVAVLKPTLSILVRLATMRIFRKEENSGEHVETIPGLIAVPHTQRLGCVVQLAAEGMETLERRFKGQPEFGLVLNEVRMAIMKARTSRKIDLKTMPIRAPEMFAKLKIKKAEQKKKQKKIKRVDFISNKRKLIK